MKSFEFNIKKRFINNFFSYVDCIINANPNSKNLIILDARPSVNAKANRAKGGGYEEYERCKLKFLDIPNIHAVRDSFKRIKDACFPRIDHKNFYKALDETKWLDHIQVIKKKKKH